MINRSIIAAVLLFLSACATQTAINRDELTEARAAIEEARAAGAESHAPRLMAEAVSSLYRAAHELSELGGSEGELHPEDSTFYINRAISKARQALALARLNGKPATASGGNMIYIRFDNNSSWLNRAAAAELDQILTRLNQHPEMQIVIEGHASSPETEHYNLWLSRRRTKRVVDYLLAHGIDEHRLRYHSYGESRLLADEAMPDGEARNRRVELHLTK